MTVSLSPHLHSPTHTRNPQPAPYTKLLTTECSEAILHICPLQPSQSRSLTCSLQALLSISLLHAPSPQSHRPPTWHQSNRREDIKLLPLPRRALTYVQKVTTEGSAVAMSKHRVSHGWMHKMVCEISWPTLLLFLEHTVINDRYRYRYRYMAMDRSGYRGN